MPCAHTYSAAIRLPGDVRGGVPAGRARDVRVECGRAAARRHQTAALRRATGARAHVEHWHLELDPQYDVPLRDHHQRM